MGRLKTIEERIAKRAKPKKDDTMTQKDWQAIQRDQRAKAIMDRLRGVPVQDAKDSLKAQKQQQRVVTFGHHTAHQKKA